MNGIVIEDGVVLVIVAIMDPKGNPVGSSPPDAIRSGTLVPEGRPSARPPPSEEVIQDPRGLTD